MKGRRLLAGLLAIALAVGNLMISSPVKAEETVVSTALANSDFAEFSASGDSTLTDGSRTITLVSEGTGVKPSLVNDGRRGKVLQLNGSTYANRAFALLPSNPFAGQDVTNGLTLNFWTSTNQPVSGTSYGNSCLIDFDLGGTSSEARNAPGSLAINQEMVYWNTTGQNSQFMDFATGNLGLTNGSGWKMVTMVVTTSGIAFYCNGKKITHTLTSNYEENYSQMINDLAGSGGLVTSPEETNVRIGASLATYWNCADALIDDISFYGKALSDEEVTALWEETDTTTYVDELPEAYYLTVYSTTTDYYASAENVEQETRSVYMAVSREGKTFDVLNNGGGVIFSKNTSGTLQITEPLVF